MTSLSKIIAKYPCIFSKLVVKYSVKKAFYKSASAKEDLLAARSEKEQV
jgi:hypothetical protein